MLGSIALLWLSSVGKRRPDVRSELPVHVIAHVARYVGDLQIADNGDLTKATMEVCAQHFQTGEIQVSVFTVSRVIRERSRLRIISCEVHTLFKGQELINNKLVTQPKPADYLVDFNDLTGGVYGSEDAMNVKNAALALLTSCSFLFFGLGFIHHSKS